ncbi:MAG: hypothetical protein R3293_05330 [Candidatus Promineifilaceae bacterium]|nr:hypothetical protein [Candidatus Promineifilaceae bacterium]
MQKSAPSPTAVSGVLSTIAPAALEPPAAASSTPAIELLPTPWPTALSDSLPTIQHTAVPTPDHSPQPAVIPTTRFSALRFASAPTAATQDAFPPGTDEVFAIWDYQEMQPSDRIRRIWFRDGQIWITREENWNWGNYGSTGTVLDNSVYDHEGSGLPPARYDLQLYVNDQLQQEGTFVVLAP